MSDDTSQQLTRITVDTNLLISGFIRTGTPPRQLLQVWIRGAVRLVTSADIRAEIAEVLHRPTFARYRFDAQLMAAVLEALAVSEPVEPLPASDLPFHGRDRSDDLFLACALAAHRDYLVTGDNALHELAGQPALGAIRIVTVRELLARIGSGPDARQPRCIVVQVYSPTIATLLRRREYHPRGRVCRQP